MNELTVGSMVCVELLDRCLPAVIERIEIQTPGCLWAEVTCRGHVRLFSLEDFEWDDSQMMWKIKAFGGWYTGHPTSLEHLGKFKT